jgi:redox-sensitive bicupin YhaK (pirin superfamily)
MTPPPDGSPTEHPRETRRIAFVLEGKPRDLGGFTVRRALPSMNRRRVGPFVFFDHMGPFEVTPERDVNVRPHPHIGLATVTYLFDGEILHRDSLGSRQSIVPGDVNWMTAGRGIVHSERTDEATLKRGGIAHGLQCWVGLPTKDEECEPSFSHYAASAIPTATQGGIAVRVVIGSAHGVTSPVLVSSPTLFLDAQMAEGQTMMPPEGVAEMAAYVAQGSVTCDDAQFGEGTMLVFRDAERPTLTANAKSRVVLVGGAPLDGERYLFWNFVASTKERLEKAKRDWKEGRFPKVPGDDVEFIPLPE